MYRATLLFVCLFVVSLANGQTSRKGKDYALFFAVSDYEDNSTWNNLKNPIQDAEVIADVLERYYNFETEIHRNPSLEKIEQVLAEWQRKSFLDNAQLLVLFSGHGYFNEFNKNGYFVPRDGQGNNYRSFFELADIGNIVTQIACKHILLAIDACYSGTIDREIAFKGGNSMRRPGETPNSDRERFIERQMAFKSRLLITSGGKERTPDNSQFVEAFLSGLRGTYSRGDGLFAFPDLLAKLSRVIPKPHQGILPNHEDGGFVFVSNAMKSNNNPPVLEKARQPSSKTLEEGISNTSSPSSTEAIVKTTANTFTTEDGNTYSFKTMKDGKEWMTKNLNIKIDNSYCYGNDLRNCEIYGRLYTWEAAGQACATLGSGWRLPTEAEWRKLAESYGGYYDNRSGENIGTSKGSAKSLRTGGESGFAALFGGIRVHDGSAYNYKGMQGYYWSSTARDNGVAWNYFLTSKSRKLYRNGYRKMHAESVRCIKD